MVKLLSIISIVLAIVLFPPATLAVISNNAVPGDLTYAIKRSLEDGIYAIASVNSVSKAWFSAARSDRRYKEVSALITQGKVAKDTLSELVTQTDTTAIQIAQIQDPVQKQQLIASYTQTIEKYDQGLQQLAQASTSAPETTSQVTTTRPTSIPTYKPTSTLIPTPSITPSPSSTTSQSTSGLTDKQDIEDAIEKLEKIRNKLKQHENNNQKENKDNQNEKQNQKEVTDTPKSVKSIKETK